MTRQIAIGGKACQSWPVAVSAYPRMSHLSTLIEGYRRFRETGWAHERERWSELAEGQSPKVMILSCADSRVDPAQIFDARPGEMFVLRNIAALAPDRKSVV